MCQLNKVLVVFCIKGARGVLPLKKWRGCPSYLLGGKICELVPLRVLKPKMTPVRVVTVPFSGVFENFWRAPRSFSYGSTPPPLPGRRRCKTNPFFTEKCKICKFEIISYHNFVSREFVTELFRHFKPRLYSLIWKCSSESMFIKLCSYIFYI